MNKVSGVEHDPLTVGGAAGNGEESRDLIADYWRLMLGMHVLSLRQTDGLVGGKSVDRRVLDGASSGQFKMRQINIADPPYSACCAMCNPLNLKPRCLNQSQGDAVAETTALPVPTANPAFFFCELLKIGHLKICLDIAQSIPSVQQSEMRGCWSSSLDVVGGALSTASVIMIRSGGSLVANRAQLARNIVKKPP